MQKAFIFDMDGVIVQSEHLWAEKEPRFLLDFFGQDIALQIAGKTHGVDIYTIWDWGKKYGHQKNNIEEFEQGYNRIAAQLYQEAPISEGLEKLIQKLHNQKYNLGLVSSSKLSWIQNVLNRLPYRQSFSYVVSVCDREDLLPKPAPDGYIETIISLGASPPSTLILEDSNTGILAAKASGAQVICFKQHLPLDYISLQTDHVAYSMDEVTDIIKKIQ